MIVISAALLQAQTNGPPQARYLDAVEAYRMGDVNPAIASINLLSSAELGAASATVGAAYEWPFRKAAAMLHTEVAIRRTGASPVIPLHLRLAATLLATAPPEELGFVERWYGFAGQFLLAHSRSPDVPRRFIESGLQLSRVNPPLQLLAGLVSERLAGLNESGPQNREVREQLEDAEDAYRLALEQAPDLVEARLRLGRVLFLRGRPGEAREVLAKALESTTDPRLLYLAHLFQGAVNQADERWAAARAEYEAAMALGPERQTPYIALSFVEQAAGNLARARDLATMVIDLPKPAVSDPWWDYPTGVFDIETLRWLRAQLRP